MKYALLIYGDEDRWETLPEETKKEIIAGYDSFVNENASRGVVKGGEELHGTTSATTVRVRNGDTLVTDGPFAETKEQLGGFFLVECKDMDEAIELATRIPGALSGSIEVRPCVEHPEMSVNP